MHDGQTVLVLYLGKFFLYPVLYFSFNAQAVQCASYGINDNHYINCRRQLCSVSCVMYFERNLEKEVEGSPCSEEER